MAGKRGILSQIGHPGVHLSNLIARREPRTQSEEEGCGKFAHGPRSLIEADQLCVLFLGRPLYGKL